MSIVDHQTWIILVDFGRKTCSSSGSLLLLAGIIRKLHHGSHHTLLQIPIAAHIKDGFHIYCNYDNLEEWAATATLEEFEKVTFCVFEKLFSTAALEKLAALPKDKHDTMIENAILQNCDVFTVAQKTVPVFGHFVMFGL